MNEIIKTSTLPTGIVKADDAVFDMLSQGGMPWAPVQIYGGNSSAVKDEKIGVNRIGIYRGKDEIEDLGKEIDIVPVAWRPRATEFGGSALTVYDPEDPEFKRIVEKAAVNSKGAMYGVEFLLWFPKTSEFLTYFFGGKSTRRVSAKVRELMGQAATIVVDFAENQHGKWPVPLVKACASPLTAPNPEDLDDIVTKFKTPPKNEVEKAEDTGRAT